MKWVVPSTLGLESEAMGIATINPATGETIKSFEPLSGESIEAKLALAQQTFEQYRKIPMTQRAEWLNVAAEILERDKVSFGKIMTTEMGKTLKSRSEERFS